MSGGNGSMNIHTLYQHDWDFNNGDVSSGIGFIHGHTLSQCNHPITFKDMYGVVVNCDISGGHGSVKSHNIYQQNGLKPFIDLNNRDNIEMNYELNNGDVSRGIGLINIHTLYQFNESS